MAAAQCGSSNQLHLKRLVVTSAVQQQIGSLWPIGWQLHPLAWFQSGGCVAFRAHITPQQQNSSQWPDSQLMCSGRDGGHFYFNIWTSFTNNPTNRFYSYKLYAALKLNKNLTLSDEVVKKTESLTHISLGLYSVSHIRNNGVLLMLFTCIIPTQRSCRGIPTHHKTFRACTIKQIQFAKWLFPLKHQVYVCDQIEGFEVLVVTHPGIPFG